MLPLLSGGVAQLLGAQAWPHGMPLNGLVAYLRRAVPYFSRSAVGGACDGAILYVDFSPISGLIREAEASWASADPAAKAEVTGLLLEVGDALATLEGQLAAALAVQRSEAGQRGVRAELMAQMGAALPVLRECAALARVAQLTPEQTARFARCGTLVTGSAARALHAMWLKSFAPALRDPSGQHPASRQPLKTAYDISTATMQLLAADRLLQLLVDCGGSGGLAAFAADVWTPEVVSRWLASLLVVVHIGKDAGCHHGSLSSLAAVCDMLLGHPELAPHQAAMQASPALQSKLAALLPDMAQVAWIQLQHVFATGLNAAGSRSSAPNGAGAARGSATAAAGGPDGRSANARRGGRAAELKASDRLRTAAACLRLGTAPCLQAGVRRLAVVAPLPLQQQQRQQQQKEALKGWLTDLATVLQALPAERPSSMPAAEYVQLLLLAVTAAAHPCSLADSAAAQEAPTTSHLSEEQLGDWGMAQFSSGMPAAHMLPHLARVLGLPLRDSELAAQLATMPAAAEAACNAAAAAVRHAARGIDLAEAMQCELMTRISDGAAHGVAFLSTTAAAVLAIFQLVHVAAELPLLAVRTGRQQGLATAGAQLADSCLRNGAKCFVTFFQLGRKLEELLPAPELCTALRQQQMPAQLWQLHTTACRFLHYVASAAPEQLAAVPILSNWPLIATSGCMTFRTTADLALGKAAEVFDAGALQAMAAAAADLQLVSLPLLHSSDARRNRLAGACSPEHYGLVVECLVQAYALDGVPYGSQSAARQALVDTLRSQIQNFERGARAAIDNCSFTLHHAVDSGQLAAVLAASGLLGRILRASLEQRAAGRMAPEAATSLQIEAMRVLELLPAVAETLADVPATSPAAQEVARRCRAAAASLSAASQALRKCTPVQVAEAYPSQLEAAVQATGAALEAFGELPEHGNEQLLDLALSAGLRSCAYLRCTNVAAVGGAGAGEQEGSSRCSQCRVAWYCGTACSHADWRAGHRRTCKALAAARQMTKAAEGGEQQL